MIVEYVRYEVPEARAEAFLRAYAEAAGPLQRSPPCLGYEVARCMEDPKSFVVRILWDSEDGHLKGFRGSAEFRPFFAAVQPFVKEIREMRHYLRTDLVWTMGA